MSEDHTNLGEIEGLASPPPMFTMTDEEPAAMGLWVEELDAALAAAHDMGLPVAAFPVVLQGGSRTAGLPA